MGPRDGPRAGSSVRPILPRSQRVAAGARPVSASASSIPTAMTQAQQTETWSQPEGTRATSFGEAYNPTLVDRFGVWLSARQIRRHVRDFQGGRIGDFGCGF